MSLIAKTAVFAVMLNLLTGCIGLTGVQARDSRLSCAVALVYNGKQISRFLEKPGESFVQAYVRFDKDLPDDVIFGIDQEFIDGVTDPFHIKGGDWMSFIGLQRNGAVWVAIGTDETMKGKPSRERTWKILNLGQQLKPNTWYRLRTEVDFGTRHFRKFTIEGPDFSKSLELSGFNLDYPNYMPFNGRSISYYVYAMRGRSLINQNSPWHGKPIVYFDDVSGGPIAKNGHDIVVFEDGFEDLNEIDNQPVILPVIDLTGYKQGRWYLERDEALFYKRKMPFAHSGQTVGVADANID